VPRDVATVMIIPRAAVPITRSAFDQCLSAASASGQHGRYGTTALSLFPELVLGVPFSENLQPPGQTAFNQAAPRKRVQHLTSQASRILNGDFTGARDAAAKRDAPAVKARGHATPCTAAAYSPSPQPPPGPPPSQRRRRVARRRAPARHCPASSRRPCLVRINAYSSASPGLVSQRQKRKS
jgi:hypothetical protein